MIEEISEVTNAFDPKTMRKHLNAMRAKHGANTAIGSRCSNIVAQIDALPRPPEEWIDYLMPDWVPQRYEDLSRAIAQQVKSLSRLAATAQNAEDRAP